MPYDRDSDRLADHWHSNTEHRVRSRFGGIHDRSDDMLNIPGDIFHIHQQQAYQRKITSAGEIEQTLVLFYFPSKTVFLFVRRYNLFVPVQVILFTGICIMILSTYANLYALEESANIKTLATTSKPLNQMNNLPLKLNNDGANVPKSLGLLDVKGKIDRPDVSLDEPINAKANDVRQEPPIPVERIVVTEKIETQKPVENSVITFAPKKEEAKAMNEQSPKESKTVTRNDSVKAEYGTVKVENVESKDLDTQKNDNLINSDAIKKEEIELAADADAANIIAAERHEKFRKTLEKYQKEQLEMMQEQKEILKDLKEQKEILLDFKEQKQEIERQKLKEIEKQKLKEIEGQEKEKEKVKAQDTNMNVRKGEPSKKVQQNVDTKRESAKSDKENHNFDGLKIEPLKIKELNIPSEKGGLNKENDQEKGENSFSKDTNNEILNNKGSDKRIEVNVKVDTTNELPRGPILNALTKRVLRKSVSELVDNEDTEVIAKKNDSYGNLQNKSGLNAEKPKAQGEYSLPIALKMQSQTKVENASDLLANKSEENIQAMRRDILENHEREKREIDVHAGETDIKVSNNISIKDTDPVKNSTVKEENEKCSKPSKNANEDLISKSEETNRLKKEKSPNRDLIEESLIKTNVYLSEQELTNAMAVDPNIAVRGEYVKLKQRDLKSVNVNENCNI